MMELLLDGRYYLQVKALHIICVILWMSGMLHLPRLLARHHRLAPDSADQPWQQLEQQLMQKVINPSMLAVFVLGIWLALVTGAWTQPWFQLKFILLLVLGGLHGQLSRARKAFARGERPGSERHFQRMGYLIVGLLITIVLLVVLKPSFF